MYLVFYCRDFHTGKKHTISSKFATMAYRTRNHIVVVGIDFGTTYSGYAYSFRSDFIKDKTDHLNKIYTNNWNCGDLMSEKTPTTLLLDKNKKFVSFGYDAENDYSRKTEEERKEHYYFRRFKMALYDKDGKLVSSVNMYICIT